MLVREDNISKYLEDYNSGRIKKGLKIDCDLDDYLRFKKGSFNMILGHDNTGKTYWRCWYYLVLAVKHNLRFCIWTGENKAGQIVRNLIKIYTGEDPQKMTLTELYRYQQELSQWFDFVDNSNLYKYNELLDIFGEGDYASCLIDPYTGLDRDYTHSANYQFLNDTRQWVNQTGISIDVCTHPVSSAGRGGAVYPKGHEWEGHIRNPFKSDTEGGKPFANRCDDFFVCHRLPSSPTMKTYTLIYVEKVKDVETGGQITEFDTPLLLDFNNGYGFKINGVNPLTDKNIKPKEGYQPKKLIPSTEFDEEIKKHGVEYNPPKFIK